MNFQVGDAVRILGAGETGKVYYILPNSDVCAVEIDGTGAIGFFYSDQISPICTASAGLVGTGRSGDVLLPDGMIGWITPSVNAEISAPAVVPQKHTLICDCGGLKTFGSMSPENHSHWCASRA